MTPTALDVVRGAAVVIDDRIGQESDIDDLLLQLREAFIPTVELKALPPVKSLVHWKQFSLIIMDWALTDSGEVSRIELPAGLTLPSTLSEDVVVRNIEFIEALLVETTLPVFIATNEVAESVRAALDEGLKQRFPYYHERVHVFRKSELKPDLFDTIAGWISLRPALRVLENWRRAYAAAEVRVFHQFAQAQHDWVASVQRAAGADAADVHVMLRDLIAANILNRIGPLDVDLDGVATEGVPVDATALRRVLHYSAVVPDGSLAKSEVGTGDLFVVEGAVEPYVEIHILLTPECDLTLRDDSWRFTTLVARRNPRVNRNPGKRVGDVWKLSKSKELWLTVNLLTEDCVEYDVEVNGWKSEMVTPEKSGGALNIWPGYTRIGRLLPPYSTYLQQNFALVAIRAGMPRLPADLYDLP